MRRIARYCISLIVLLITSCGSNQHEAFDDAPHGLISIAHLKTLCREGSTTITYDISIEGYVVANDLFGEYQKSIVLCDDSGGIEITIDCDNTAVRFPISARVVIHCTGLALGNYGGHITLGAVPTSSYTIDRIAERDIDRYMRIDKLNPKEIKPQVITIDKITTRHIGNYIALEDVTFGDDAGLTWCDIDPTTNKYITTTRSLQDRAGNSLNVRTIAECDYREEKIPAGYGSVWGIVEYFDKAFSLRIVNHRIEF